MSTAETAILRTLHSIPFHSGYIPIVMLKVKIYAELTFTFHSGYIPIGRHGKRKTPAVAFTFHSGYIPMPSFAGLASLIRPLHSILDIFQFQSFLLIRSFLHLYIPFWIYSNILFLLHRHRYAQLYIPFWIYSNIALFNIFCMPVSLYIPFWIYSNRFRPVFKFNNSVFTFHSGYIPINVLDPKKHKQTALHSILDIFQSGVDERIIQKIVFTFHSGYIPILFTSFTTVLSLSFTFHSGYIPMYRKWRVLIMLQTLHSILVIFQSVPDTQESICMRTLHSILVIFQCKYFVFSSWSNRLYIPFWLYSNYVFALGNLGGLYFTFHSGYIPMLNVVAENAGFTSLHSILVIFQYVKTKRRR